MIEFVNLDAVNKKHCAGLLEVSKRVIDSGWYILGPELEAFEQEFADFCRARHCVGVGNGLDALKLILRALRIGPGDEVIAPANTFIATWLAISSVGAKIVPVDPVPSTYNIDVAAVRAALTPRTRAVIAVHLYGQPAEMEQLASLLSARGVALVEDAAQAHGATLNGRRAGSLGLAAAFSFYPTKNLGALGDGGAITTDDAELASICRRLRNYGATTKYHHEALGVNSRLDELQAAFLRLKLKSLDDDNRRRSVLVDRYISNLEGTGLTLPVTIPGASPVWHLFVVRHPKRETLIDALKRHDIQFGIHYPRACHLQPAYSNMPRPHLPLSEHLQDQVLSLPLSSAHTLDEVDTVSTVLAEALSHL